MRMLRLGINAEGVLRLGQITWNIVVNADCMQKRFDYLLK